MNTVFTRVNRVKNVISSEFFKIKVNGIKYSKIKMFIVEMRR